MVDKRGASKAFTAIVIILAIIIIGLVIWSISNAINKDSQPDPVAEQCAFFCETNQTSAFCSFRVSASDNLRVSCNELVTNSQYSQYGVQACPTISCESQVEGNSALAEDQTCAGLEGTWEQPTETGSCPAKDGFFSRERTAEDNPPIEGQICCYYYQ